MKNLWEELIEETGKMSSKVLKIKKSKGESNKDLWVALMNLDEEGVQRALEEGANPDARFMKSKLYPIQHALMKGQTGIADKLIDFKSKALQEVKVLGLILEEDRKESLQWLLNQKKEIVNQNFSFFYYDLMPSVTKGKTKCFQWFLENASHLSNIKEVEEFNTLNEKNKFEWALTFLINVPDFAWKDESLKSSMQKNLNPTSLEKLKAWNIGVLKDKVDFLKIMLKIGWIPEEMIENNQSWTEKAILNNSGKVLSWFLKAPSFEQKFLEEMKDPNKKIAQKIMNDFMAPEIISLLSDYHLLPIKNTKNYLFKFSNLLTKNYMELLARKWPQLLEEKNNENQTIFEYLIDSFNTDKILEWKSSCESIMMKKSIPKALTQKQKKENQVPLQAKAKRL